MDTEKLKELVAAGTPGEWTPGYSDAMGQYVQADDGYVAIVHYWSRPHDEMAANAALICAAVNALPSLLAELESAREIIEAQSSDVILARESIEGPAMSADELLPLPDFPNQLEFPHTDSWMRQAIRDYATTTARANVAHATAGLRAEVERLTVERDDAQVNERLISEAYRHSEADCVGLTARAERVEAELAATREALVNAREALKEMRDLAYRISQGQDSGAIEEYIEQADAVLVAMQSVVVSEADQREQK